MKAGFRPRSLVRAAFLLTIAIAPSVAAPLAAQAEASALAALETGEYDDAIRQLRRLARGRDATVAVHRALASALRRDARLHQA